MIKLNEQQSINYSDRRFITFTRVDESRFILADEFGNLFLLAMKNTELILQFLGEVNYPSTVCYLDNNYLFVGSEKGNSMLVKITKIITSNLKSPFVEVIEEFDSLAPISDFCILSNSENTDEILCVTGCDRTSCLKTVRKGASVIHITNLDVARAKSAYSIKLKNAELLFVNSIVGSELILIDEEDRISCLTNSQIYLNEITSFALDFNYNQTKFILQICQSFFAVYSEDLNLVFKYNINANPVLCQFKAKNGFLYLFDRDNKLSRFNLFKLLEKINDEIEDIIISNTLISAFDVSDNNVLIFSTWNSNKIFIHNLKNKRLEILTELDDNDSFCNGVVFLKNEGSKYLFLSISNGKMLFYKQKSKNIIKISQHRKEFCKLHLYTRRFYSKAQIQHHKHFICDEKDKRFYFHKQ
jgi:hypothetical protein